MSSKKRATPVSLQPLDALFGTNEETTNGISEIAIGSLHPFTNHPFQVRDDKKMEELAESIGALIGSIMIPVYVIRAIYVFIRYIIER